MAPKGQPEGKTFFFVNKTSKSASLSHSRKTLENTHIQSHVQSKSRSQPPADKHRVRKSSVSRSSAPRSSADNMDVLVEFSPSASSTPSLIHSNTRSLSPHEPSPAPNSDSVSSHAWRLPPSSSSPLKHGGDSSWRSHSLPPAMSYIPDLADETIHMQTLHDTGFGGVGCGSTTGGRRSFDQPPSFAPRQQPSTVATLCQKALHLASHFQSLSVTDYHQVALQQISRQATDRLVSSATLAYSNDHVFWELTRNEPSLMDMCNIDRLDALQEKLTKTYDAASGILLAVYCLVAAELWCSHLHEAEITLSTAQFLLSRMPGGLMSVHPEVTAYLLKADRQLLLRGGSAPLLGMAAAAAPAHTPSFPGLEVVTPMSLSYHV